jgi:hypothetical protein
MGEAHKQIEEIRKRPTNFLVHPRNSVNHNLSAKDEYRVDEPGA